jgi:hypothetical protein
MASWPLQYIIMMGLDYDGHLQMMGLIGQN